MKQQKPKTIPFLKFYWEGIVRLLSCVGEGAIELCADIRLAMIGGWWCEKCGKYHGRRVYKKVVMYHRGEIRVAVCSIGYDTPGGMDSVITKLTQDIENNMVFQSHAQKW